MHHRLGVLGWVCVWLGLRAVVAGMSFSADWFPVGCWQIAWNAVGPFRVDTWDTSFTAKDGSRIKAHRVVGEHGFQCSIPTGEVIMFSREYAQAVCDAANAGALRREEEPRVQHRSKRG